MQVSALLRTIRSVSFVAIISVQVLAQGASRRPSNSAVNAADFPGVDIGDKINAAVTATPASGGLILVPAAPSCYDFSTEIKVLSKAIVLQGSGPGTCLNFIATTGTAITFAGIASAAYVGQAFGAGIRDITLQGTGTANDTVGLYLNGVAGFTAMNTNIMQFGTGITFGNNTFTLNWQGGSIRANNTNLIYNEGLMNSGESLSFVNTSFSNGGQKDGTSTGQNCVNILQGPYGQSVEMNFVNDSFDSCQVVIGNDNAMQIRFINPHFEDDQSALDYPFVKQVSSVSYKGTDAEYVNPMFFVDAPTVTADSFIELNGSSHANLQNPEMFGYGGTSTTPAFVRIQGKGTAMLSLTGIPIGNNHTVGTPPFAAPPLFSTDSINTPVIVQPPLTTSLSTNSSTEDVVRLVGMTAAGHCHVQPTNAAAARNVTSTFVSNKSAGSLTITHPNVPGMTFDITCTSN